MLIQKQGRIKTAEVVKKRIKSQLNSQFRFERTPELKIRARNRYPIQVPTSSQLFKKDTQWKYKANPSVLVQEEKFKQADLLKMERQKEAKRIQELRQMDVYYSMSYTN